MSGHERGNRFPKQRVPERLVRPEDEDRRTATGINIIYPRDERPLDSAFNVRKRGEEFIVKASLLDLSPFVSKDDHNDRNFRAEKEKSVGDSFMPNTAFSTDRGNPSLTVTFTLTPDENNELQIIKPDIFRSDLHLTNVYLFSQANQIVQDKETPDLKDFVALIPHLDKRKKSRPRPLYEKSQTDSNITVLRNLKRNLARLTNEAAAKYCMERNIPVIYSQLNYDNIQYEYTLTPSPEKPYEMSIEGALRDYLPIMNGRILTAFLQDQPFPYQTNELHEFVNELNSYAGSKERHEKKALAIQVKKEGQRIAQLDQRTIEELETADFRNLFLQAMTRLPNNRVRRQIQAELAERMSEGRAHVRDIQDVLFKFPPSEGGIMALQEEAIIALYMHAPYINSTFAYFRGINNLFPRGVTNHIRRKQTKEGDEVFDTAIIVEREEGELVSETFRSKEKVKSTHLAMANVLSKAIGIGPETDKELREEAGLVNDQTGRALSREEREEPVKPIPKEKREKSWHDSLRELCEQNGFQISDPEISRNTEGKYPYTARIQILIDDLTIVHESSFKTPNTATAGAARSLYNILTNPKVDEESINPDITSELLLLTERQQLPPYEFQTRTTTNAQGEELVHCIGIITHPGREQTIIATASNEDDARILAAAKIFTVYNTILSKEK